MMKLKYRVNRIIICFCVVFSLAACDKKTDNKDIVLQNEATDEPLQTTQPADDVEEVEDDSTEEEVAVEKDSNMEEQVDLIPICEMYTTD